MKIFQLIEEVKIFPKKLNRFSGKFNEIPKKIIENSVFHQIISNEVILARNYAKVSLSEKASIVVRVL